jgi:biotin synthase
MPSTSEAAIPAHNIHFHQSYNKSREKSEDFWPLANIKNLFNLAFSDLIFQAQTVHRQHFNANEIELASLLSVKTGGCPENCGYCPQSVHFNTGVTATKMLTVDEVYEAALAAKTAGATRFCMGAAWRSVKDRDVAKIVDLIRCVKGIGLEACATMGMLEDGQAETFKAAGLDYYNHNLDTAPENYENIISTRDYEDRLATLDRVRKAGISVCCGGIVGLGESRDQRAKLISELANMLPSYPESVPINNLVRIEGTPLADIEELDPFEFIRTIAVARITMPRARVRLSAGRKAMGEHVQALCFLAGANSIFYGEKLLTSENPEVEADKRLLKKLGMNSEFAFDSGSI